MSKFFCLNFMQPLNSVLSGGRSVIVTWLSERNRVKALAVGAPLLTRFLLFPSWKRSPPTIPSSDEFLHRGPAGLIVRIHTRHLIDCGPAWQDTS